MAKRGRKPGFTMPKEHRAKISRSTKGLIEPPLFYIYRVFDGHETVYVGKGSGNRSKCQARRFGLPVEIIERLHDESEAFKRERHWIAELKPTVNISPGGNGGRLIAIPPIVPAWARKELAEVNREGTRKYVAKFLLRKLNESNAAQWGLSKVDLNRLREVANGCGG